MLFLLRRGLTVTIYGPVSFLISVAAISVLEQDPFGVLVCAQVIDWGVDYGFT